MLPVLPTFEPAHERRTRFGVSRSRSFEDGPIINRVTSNKVAVTRAGAPQKGKSDEKA